MKERLVIDPIKCTAHGMCAELFPEWIEMDDWGYPIIRAEPVPPSLRDHAMQAVRACPAMALRLAGDRAPASAGRRSTSQLRREP